MIIYPLLSLITILLIVVLVFAYKAANVSSAGNQSEIKYKIESLIAEIGRIETSVKSEISTNRTEGNEIAKSTRHELSESLKNFEDKLNNLTIALESKLTQANETNDNNSKDNRKEIKEALELCHNI